MKLPSGPGAPAGDAADAIAQATTSCHSISTITSEIAVSGSIGGRRLRARLVAGLASPASARIEAVAPFGQPLFILVSRGGDATLLLPRDNRVLEHGKSAEVLEAVAGVPLDDADLRPALTGCAVAPRADEAHAFGDDWRMVPDGPTSVYLHRDARTGPWRIVAVVHHASADVRLKPDTPSAPRSSSRGVRLQPDPVDWRAEYADFQNGLPRTVRFRSADGKRFDLRLALSQVDLNPTLDADAFRVQIPRDADPITIEELRESGPLAGAAKTNGTH